MAKRLDLVGKQFGKLTVTSYSHTDKGLAFWNCACECGNELKVPSGRLKYKITKSCGCLKKLTSKINGRKTLGPKKELGFAAKNYLMHQYKASALRRNLEYNLVYDQFIALTSQNCHYCNLKPSTSIINSAKRQFNGDYIYNGIDRKNNMKGYTIDNCVTCCTDCNYIKGPRSYEEFLNKIKTIYENRGLDGKN